MFPRHQFKSNPQGGDGGLYHEGCRGDIREEVDRHPSADEDSGRQDGKVLAAAPTGGVGPGVVANHDASLFQASTTLLQVATETLLGKTKVGRRENEPAAEGRQQKQQVFPPTPQQWSSHTPLAETEACRGPHSCWGP